jgi:hypothetical protein
MDTTFRALCILGLAAASLAAADAPYIGKWKLNPAKSQLTGETVTVEKMPDGTIHQQQGDFVFSFKLDGKEYPMPDGSTTAWKVVDANTWDRVDRAKGKVAVTSRLTLQGDIVTITYHATKPDGGTLDGSSKWKRVSGGPGFYGKFKSTEQNSAFSNMELTANGADGVSFRFPDDGSMCDAKLDGKDYPVTGPQAGGKETFSLKKTGARSIEITEKLDGKPMGVDKFVVSADGKTLTDEGTPASTKEITKAVFDRQ